MGKQNYIRAFFDEFGRKILRLTQLVNNSFGEEAFTLCVVYIDRLASGHFGGGPGKNHENFCRALRELSGDPVFTMLYPRELMERTTLKFPKALAYIKAVVDENPHTLLEEAHVARAVRNSPLDDSIKESLTANLWRSSIASICYSEVRVPEIHGAGSGGLLFDQTTYDGQKLQVDFLRIHKALWSIYEQIKSTSIQSGDWFGNPDYLKSR